MAPSLAHSLVPACVCFAAAFGSLRPVSAADAPGGGGGAATPVTALLVIDIQDFYYPGGALPLVGPEAASASAAKLLAAARAKGVFIVHVGHNAKAGRGLHADVAPLPGETVVMKDDINAFKGTDLQERLQAAGVRRLVICGMQTHMCVEAASRAASDLGYEVLVVADACATRDLAYGDTKVPAAQVHAATLATLSGNYAKIVTVDEGCAAF
jgi:nicotinamidase-related amidase